MTEMNDWDFPIRAIILHSLRVGQEQELACATRSGA